MRRSFVWAILGLLLIASGCGTSGTSGNVAGSMASEEHGSVLSAKPSPVEEEVSKQEARDFIQSILGNYPNGEFRNPQNLYLSGGQRSFHFNLIPAGEVTVLADFFYGPSGTYQRVKGKSICQVVRRDGQLMLQFTNHDGSVYRFWKKGSCMIGKRDNPVDAADNYSISIQACQD